MSEQFYARSTQKLSRPGRLERAIYINGVPGEVYNLRALLLAGRDYVRIELGGRLDAIYLDGVRFADGVKMTAVHEGMLRKWRLDL